jgi:hypothetical protein
MRRLDSPSFQFALGDRDQLKHQLELALRQPNSGGTYLQDAIRGFTQRARADGQPVERVIIALKELASMASAASSHPEPEAALREDVVKWCLEEYYRES